DFHVTGVQTCALPISIIAVTSFVKLNNSQRAALTADDVNAFNQWASRHNKQYATPSERQFRLGVFAKRFAQILAHNSQKRSWTKIGRASCRESTWREV